jgi:hypothetical protein
MLPEHQTITDVHAELKGLMDGFLDAVSFDQGSRPHYERIRDIVIDKGKLIKAISVPAEVSTVDQFIAPRRQMVDSGELTAFKETERSAVTEVFGNVAHRFSTYDKSGISNGAAFTGAGMISTQFVRTVDGWKISSMAWDDERAGLTIPDHRG